MTCGLTAVGSSCEDGDETTPLHGCVHHTPARHVAAFGAWTEDGRYTMMVRGEIAEESLFGHRLVLVREIRAELGLNRIELRDTVENRGARLAPHMLLYHCNLGYPFLQPSTRMHFPSRRVVPREEGSSVDAFDQWRTPGNVDERVFYHEDIQSEREIATATVITPDAPFATGAAPLRIAFSWSVDTLPELVEWWMPGRGAYALGIEPANCRVGGRAAERAAGRLVELEPGEVRHTRLSIKCDSEGVSC